MKKVFTTRKLCRAGIIAALYVAFTYAFAPFAFGPIQVRPAEALCILPLFYIEAVPALFVGCMLSNLASPYLFYDVFIGSAVTLFAAVNTYMVGSFFKNRIARLVTGGIFPVLFNAVFIPMIIVFLCDGGAGYENLFLAYLSFAGSLALTEAVWVYALGTPLYLGVERLRKHKVSFLL